MTNSATSSISASERLSAAAAAAALLASAGLAAASSRPGADRPLAVGGHELPALCPIRRLTGHRCPGCGMLRAFVLLWRGQLREALRANPAAPVVFLLLARLALQPLRGGRREIRPAS